MSSDRKNDTGGKSDRTVMLSVDDEGNPRQESRTAPAMALEPSTLDEEPATAAAMPTAKPAPRKTGVRPALDPAAGQPPRAKTGVRSALSDPSAQPKSRALTGQRAALGSDRQSDATLPPANRHGGAGDSTLPASAYDRARQSKASEPEPDPTMDGATMMMDNAPSGPTQTEGLSEATVMKPAPSAPPERSNETMIFDSARPLPKAGRGSLATDDPDTVGRNLADDDRPTAAKRPLQDLVDGPEQEPLDPGVGPATNLTDANKGAKGVQAVVAALLLLIAGAIVVRYVIFDFSKPSDGELRLLYPYQRGGQMPNGRVAPGSTDVDFQYLGPQDCDEQRCLRYQVTNPNSVFSIEMVVRHDDDGWKLVSSTGL